MDIQHPDIERIERTGFPDAEYLSWERTQQKEAEEEIEADELWLVECRNQRKRPSAVTESLVPSNLARNEY